MRVAATAAASNLKQLALSCAYTWLLLWFQPVPSSGPVGNASTIMPCVDPAVVLQHQAVRGPTSYRFCFICMISRVRIHHRWLSCDQRWWSDSCHCQIGWTYLVHIQTSVNHWCRLEKELMEQQQEEWQCRQVRSFLHIIGPILFSFSSPEPPCPVRAMHMQGAVIYALLSRG